MPTRSDSMLLQSIQLVYWIREYGKIRDEEHGSVLEEITQKEPNNTINIILMIIFLIMQLYHDSSTTGSCLSRFLVILDMHISEEYSVHCYRPANTDISIFYVKIAIFYAFFSIFLYYRNPWLKIKPTKFVIRYFSCIFIFADYCSLCQTINNYISRIKH